MGVQKRKISPQRRAAFIVGGIAGIFFTLQLGAQLLLGVLAGIGFFLGITDYG